MIIANVISYYSNFIITLIEGFQIKNIDLPAGM